MLSKAIAHEKFNNQLILVLNNRERRGDLSVQVRAGACVSVRVNASERDYDPRF